jgi:hypothetical protein
MSSLTFVVIAALNASLAFRVFLHESAVLENTNPQTVLTPIVQAGGKLAVAGTKCSHSAVPLVVTGVQVFEALDGTGRSILYVENVGIRQPGCHTREFANIIPTTLPLGRWRLVGVETAVLPNGRTESAAWRTEPFEVVP